MFFFSSRRRHTRCALVTGVQTCALPILQACRQARRPVFSGRWGLALGGAGALRHQYPLPLHHSWPLFERARHFDLGWVERAGVRPPALPPADRKSTRLNSVTNAHLVCRLLLEKTKTTNTQHDLT